MTVHEVSRLTGVSIRALHHYDAIGLLKPTRTTEAGYRLYGDEAIARLHSILMFRELEFPLADIKRILESPNYDEAEALEQQIKLLSLRRDHIETLIASAREMMEKRGNTMDFKAFDDSEIVKQAAEAKKRWGGTEAWREYEQRTHCSNEKAADEMMAIFAGIGELKELSPGDEAVQDRIRRLQEHISRSYYTCTNEILSELGKMYVSDPRFKSNIDEAGGPGTAEFAAEAIEIFCAKRVKGNGRSSF